MVHNYKQHLTDSKGTQVQLLSLVWALLCNKSSATAMKSLEELEPALRDRLDGGNPFGGQLSRGNVLRDSNSENAAQGAEL